MSDFKYYLRYALGRLLMLIAYIFTALTLVFFVINLMPGDPAYSLAVYYMQTYNLKFEQALEMARAALGYDVSKPVHVRYLEYLARLPILQEAGGGSDSALPPMDSPSTDAGNDLKLHGWN